MSSLTNKDLCFFRENGYLILNNIFSTEQLEGIKNYYIKVLSCLVSRAKIKYPRYKNIDVSLDISEMLVFLENVDHDYISQFYEFMPMGCNPYVANLSSSEKVLNCVNALLMKPLDNPLFITSGSSLFAVPNDEKYTANQWHSDVFYSIADSEYIQIWAPLISDIPESLGALHIMPNSHKDPFKGETINPSRTDSNIHKYVVSGGLTEEYGDKVISLKLGQCLFFDKHLVHRGGDNVSKQTRFSLVGVYHSVSNDDFLPYPLAHPKSPVSVDEYFDKVRSKK